ncbi:MAG TPA: hypothetical protein P5322_08970 [Spirochaetota bacterium]|nr:hypothetical protein [Spirochaetota bacterium]
MSIFYQGAARRYATHMCQSSSGSDAAVMRPICVNFHQGVAAAVM